MKLKKYTIYPTLLLAFVFICTSSSLMAASIDAHVWKDNNGNGIQDLGELGIPNVTVSLYDCMDNFIEDTITDLTGNYSFSDVAIGSYYLVFDPGTAVGNCAFTLLNAGNAITDNDADLDGKTACFDILTDEDEIDDIDAGLLRLSRICGYVWEDDNGDGLQDSIESGLGGFGVELYDTMDMLVDATVSDTLGVFEFDSLYVGEYYLKFLSQPNWDLTLDNQDPDDTSDSDVDQSNGFSTTSTFYLSAGKKEKKWDAGYYKCALLGQTLFYDTNYNDERDLIENGINGIRINVYRLLNGEWTFWDSTTSGHRAGTPSDDGYYKFCVPPGKYYIEYETSLTELIPVYPYTGDFTHDSNVSEENGPSTTATIVMLSGQDNCTIDGGFYESSTLGGKVWKDQDRDGTYQSDETLLSDVRVELYNVLGDSIATQYSDSQGNFSFEHIRKGYYYLKFYPNDGCIATIPYANTNKNIDSDVDGSNGEFTTPTIFVEPGEEIINIDLGLSAAALSVSLMDFGIDLQGSFVHLDWEVSDIQSISQFEIYRKVNHDSFVSIGTIDADVLHSNKIEFVDTDIQDLGQYYYQLHIADHDGMVSLSDVILIQVTDGVEKTIFWPNPASDMIRLEGNLVGGSKYQIRDTHGRVVAAGIVEDHGVEVSTLLNGIYTITLLSPNGNIIEAPQTFVIQY